MKVISGQGLDPVAFRQTADASGRLARSVRETTPSDVLPLDPHKGGDPRRLFTRPGTPLAKRGETIGKQIGNVPTGGRRGCPTKRRDFPLRNPPPLYASTCVLLSGHEFLHAYHIVLHGST